ncbi:22097_t:CDS:2 [Dentiscutata erythropus]|uniref:22097_t:CDS:1 n=1 Tax=Dentiscutata erythropus TaxID=1348616 RepID=A0A9N9NJ39_9GLOM|nr:22097_t:CDS:2 [Dentiscutata erythropus]
MTYESEEDSIETDNTTIMSNANSDSRILECEIFVISTTTASLESEVAHKDGSQYELLKIVPKQPRSNIFSPFKPLYKKAKILSSKSQQHNS